MPIRKGVAQRQKVSAQPPRGVCTTAKSVCTTTPGRLHSGKKCLHSRKKCPLEDGWRQRGDVGRQRSHQKRPHCHDMRQHSGKKCLHKAQKLPLKAISCPPSFIKRRLEAASKNFWHEVTPSSARAMGRPRRQSQGQS